MNVSVIVAVLNEEVGIREFVDALLKQSKKPDEIIIVDGGSTDNTVRILQEYITSGAPIELFELYKVRRIVEKWGKRLMTLPLSRNIAVENSTYDIIASIDCGIMPHKNWLKNLVKGFDNETYVVSGWTELDPKTEFEEYVAEIDRSEEFDERKHLPPR